MTKNYTILVLFGVLLCGLSGCISFSVSKNYPITMKTTSLTDSNQIVPTYADVHDFGTAYALLMPDEAYKLAKTDAQRKAAQTLKFVKDVNLQQAAENYASIIQKDTFFTMWSTFPLWYFFQTHQNDKLKEIIPRYNEVGDKSSAYMCETVLKMPEFRLDYHNDADTIPIVMDNNMPFIKIKINGKWYWICVDTGAQFTAFYKELGEALGCVYPDSSKPDRRMGELKGIGDDGSTKMVFATLPTMRLGKTNISNLPCVILQREALNVKFLFFSLAKIDGIIGWDVLSNFDFTIDYPNSQLILRKPTSRTVKHKNLMWYGMPLLKFYAGKDNYPILCMFDSGASGATFYRSEILDAVVGDMSQFETEVNTYHGVNGSVEDTTVIVPHLKLTSVADTNVYSFNYGGAKFQYTPDVHATRDMLISGNIGSGLFLNKAVRIDIANGVFEIYDSKKK